MRARALLIVATGFLCPVALYFLDPIFRYRVGYWVGPPHSIGGVLVLLSVQARDQPFSLLPLLAAPLGALWLALRRGESRPVPVTSGARPRLGGWLALFAIAIAIGVIYDVRAVYLSRHAIERSIRALPRLHRSRVPSLVLLILLRHLVVVLSGMARVAGLWLIARRSRRAPAYWTIASAVFVPLAVYHGAIGAWERHVAADAHIVLMPDARFATTAIVGAIGSGLWCVYWIRSRRVLATFGTRGLDLLVDAPPS